MRVILCKIILPLLVMFLVGCQMRTREFLVALDPEVCPKPTGNFQQLHGNPCLIDAADDLRDGILLMAPDLYAGYSGLRSFPVRCDMKGCAFYVGDRWGESGYETWLVVDRPMCLFVQVFGEYAIEDADYSQHQIRPANYSTRLWVQRDDHSANIIQRLNPDASEGLLNPFMAVWLTEADTYNVGIGIVVHEALADDGQVRLWSIAIGEDRTGYCDEETPGL